MGKNEILSHLWRPTKTPKLDTCNQLLNKHGTLKGGKS